MQRYVKHQVSSHIHKRDWHKESNWHRLALSYPRTCNVDDHCVARATTGITVVTSQPRKKPLSFILSRVQTLQLGHETSWNFVLFWWNDLFWDYQHHPKPSTCLKLNSGNLQKSLHAQCHQCSWNLTSSILFISFPDRYMNLLPAWPPKFRPPWIPRLLTASGDKPSSKVRMRIMPGPWLE